MKRIITMGLTSLALVLLVFTTAGCDTFEDIFENEKEAAGTVEEVGTDFVVVDAIRYIVTDDTEYEGISSLAELSVGDEVEIEYEERSDGTREALEIELAGAEDDD